MSGTRRPISAPCVIVMWIGAAVLGSLAAAEEPVLLDVSPRAVVEADSVDRLKLEGLPGEVRVRIGRPGEVRFVSVDAADRDVDVPLEVWRSGSDLFLRVPAESAETTLRLEATVPPGVDVDVRESGPEVRVANIDGDVAIRGEGLAVEALGTTGSVTLELRDSTIRVEGVGAGAELDLVGVQGKILRASGPAAGQIEDSTLELTGPTEGVDLDLERTRMTVAGVVGGIRLRSSDGAVDLDEIEGGAGLELDGTTLRFARIKGRVDVRTDSSVEFEECVADIHVDSFGASLTGVGNEGIVEIKSDGATVSLERIKGDVRVEGDALDVRLSQIGGATWVFVTSSECTLDNLVGSLRLQNEFGNVHVSGSSARLEMVVLDGDVRVDMQNGPVQLQTEGDLAQVAWVSLNWQQDSRIENERGDVVVGLPDQGGVSVEAESNYGGIESEIEEIRVSDDGSTASGILRRQTKPRLRIRAEGTVKILPADGVDGS